MHKLKTILTLHFTLLAFFVSVGLSGLTVMALEGSETEQKANEALIEATKKEYEAKREAAKQEYEAKREAAKQAFEENREAAKQKLEENKLRICEEREDKIDDHMDAIAQRGQKKIDLFSTIAERVKSFYLSKGKVLSNYDELVAAVGAKKVLAQTAVDAVIDASVTFDCEGDDPKGVASEFKTKVQAMNDALKEYRTAVKNLIVGVKSVQSTTVGEDD